MFRFKGKHHQGATIST